MKKLIVSILCLVLGIILLGMLYTYHKVAYDMIIDFVGGFYIGMLIGKFADWLCSK